MCKSEELLNKGSPPPAMRVDSAISSSDDSESDEGSNSNYSNHIRQQQQQQLQPQGRNGRTVPLSSTTRRKLRDCLVTKGCDSQSRNIDAQHEETQWGKITSTLASSLHGIVHASFWIAFSLYFPFFLAPHAATETYLPAYYHYDPKLSHFDNTAWTYGTDYALAVVMTIVILSIMRYSRPGVTDKLCNRSASLLMLYGISVIAGGLAHQFFLTAESRNSPAFRTLWTICVGTVCLASTSMGMSGSEALARFQKRERQTSKGGGMAGPVSILQRIPVLSDAFWIAFGCAITTVCAIGVFSFQRPACDIFLAGITQSLSTFYCMVFFFAVRHPLVKPWAKVAGLVGFIMNAPLLPMYPLLIQYTDWSLASINTLLHGWLCVAWSLQGTSMKHAIEALVADDDEADDYSVAADSLVAVQVTLRNNTKKVA